MNIKLICTSINKNLGIIHNLAFLFVLLFCVTPIVQAQEPVSNLGVDRSFDLSKNVVIHTKIYGEGTPIIILPGLGGSGIEQFAEYGPLIADSGYTVVLVDPRGIGESKGSLDSLTLHDLAADIAGLVKKLDLGKAVIIGRAFGNRVARCVAADYPEVTKAVVLIAAGGLVPIHKDIEHDFKKLISGNYSDDKELLELIQKTQFSPKSDAALYPRNSFYKEVGDAQWSTRLSTPYNDWWSAGIAPVLIIQGLDDLIAVPENGRILKMELGHRAELVEISDAGHSLYIEKPNEIVEAILEYLQTLN